MSNYEDDQSEDGELARSPVQDEMDFSLSDEDRDNADSLVIKPPQAVLRTTHRDKRGHKRVGKERFKETARKEKKHLFRERDKSEKSKRELIKNPDRGEMAKEYYREKQYYKDKESYREKEVYSRDKEAFRNKEAYREKDLYRDKEAYREKEMYRENKEAYREKEKELYREREIRDKDVYKEKEVYREKDPYREREHYREREMYRDNASFRETQRSRDVYRDKEVYKEKDVQGVYMSKEHQYKYSEGDRKHIEPERIETRLRSLAEEGHSNHNIHHEKENRDRSSGDKELEDLRTRLLNKRISKELQSQDTKKGSEYGEKESRSERSDRHPKLDKHQQERRKRLIEADREMEKRKHESRNELEARREERRRRGKKRSISPTEESNKKIKSEQSPNYGDSVVTVSDASDVEIKSGSQHSEPEDGEHTNSETEDDSSSTDSDSAAESKSEDEDHQMEGKSDKEEQNEEAEEKSLTKFKSKSPSPKSDHGTPSSHESRRFIRSPTRSKSRSRSHSFSPPPPGENGKPAVEEEKPKEDDEKARLREEAINALPPYFPALQGCRSVEEFQCLNRIEEGTYGVVYRARDKTTDEIVALKRLKMEKEKEGFPITSLREINTLLKARHLLPARGLC